MEGFQKYFRSKTAATLCPKCFQEPNVCVKMDFKLDFLSCYFPVFSHWTEVCQWPPSKVSEIVLLKTKVCFLEYLLYLTWRGTHVFFKTGKNTIKFSFTHLPFSAKPSNMRKTLAAISNALLPTMLPRHTGRGNHSRCSKPAWMLLLNRNTHRLCI